MVLSHIYIKLTLIIGSTLTYIYIVYYILGHHNLILSQKGFDMVGPKIEQNYNC